ncbi:MmyB family transcriptional regulator [Streptomyces tendae]|uniref:MmyB family transcriptional regulator n=1 Tax=Streptomyces tendae TaxID=1932 RepID=UPI003721B964
MQTPLFDVVAYNRAYRFLFTDMDLMPPGERNCAVQFFTDPDWRSRYVDGDLVAARMVARMRTEIGTELRAAAAAGIVDDLRERSEEFARLWARHDVLPEQCETKRLASPLVGPLQLNFVSTHVPGTGHRMTVMTPADEPTAGRLARMLWLCCPGTLVTRVLGASTPVFRRSRRVGRRGRPGWPCPRGSGRASRGAE